LVTGGDIYLSIIAPGGAHIGFGKPSASRMRANSFNWALADDEECAQADGIVAYPRSEAD
jgi:hypothetical protein